MRRLHGSLLGFVVAALCAAAAAQGPAQGSDDTAQVLVITGTDPLLPAFVAIDRAMRDSVERRRSVNWLYESLDALRFGTPDARFADALARKYDGVRIDAVLLVTDPAVEFYLRHGRQLWPTSPALFNFISPAFARALPPDARLGGLLAEIDYAQTLRIATALQPHARRVLVVGGTSPWDRPQIAAAQRAAAAAGYTDVEVLAGPAPTAIAARLSQLAPDTLVLYATMLSDSDRRVYVSRDVLATLSEASAVPIYGAIDTYVGVGMTAGATESLRARGERLGDLLLRVLAEPDAAPQNVEVPPSRCVADVRQLARFQLDRDRLPRGCDLRYEAPSWLRQHWWQALLVALAFAAQSLLIGALLLQRRRRRAAEVGYAAQRTQLLHASRLAVAGELTASIAHEINQPLAAILSNADAAEMQLQAGNTDQEELLQILADIKRDDLRASEVIARLRALLARHEVERVPFDVNAMIADTVAMLGAETRRRSATIESDLRASRATVSGDRIQIQQVVINLVLNALDASAALPAGDRRVVVATGNTDAGLRISVRDFGAGIPAGHLPRIFESFFSTKSSGMGLGLAIARSIVEAHGGTIAAEPLAAGTEFRVTLPTDGETGADQRRSSEQP